MISNATKNISPVKQMSFKIFQKNSVISMNGKIFAKKINCSTLQNKNQKRYTKQDGIYHDRTDFVPFNENFGSKYFIRHMPHYRMDILQPQIHKNE